MLIKNNNQGFVNTYTYGYENQNSKAFLSNPFTNHAHFGNNGNNTMSRTPRSHVEGYTSSPRCSQTSHHESEVDNEVTSEDLIRFQQDE